MDWPDHELTLWDLVPDDERECQLGVIHLLSRADVADQIFVPQICSRPWCGKCEVLRIWRLRHRIFKYLEHHRPVRLWMVTRSVRNDFRLIDAFADLHRANKQYLWWNRRIENNPEGRIFCWIGTYEITYSLSTGYNLHQHRIVGTNGLGLDYTLMHTLWDKAAGYHAQLNFKKIDDVPGAIDYISKYIAKGCWGGLSRGRAYQVRETLRGRNRIMCKHGTAVSPRMATFYVCCLAEDKNCVSWGAWDPSSTEEGR